MRAEPAFVADLAIAALAADLDPDFRLRLAVEQPGRRPVRASVRSDDEIVGAVARVDEAVRAGHARAAAGGPQQQGRHSEQARTVCPGRMRAGGLSLWWGP